MKAAIAVALIMVAGIAGAADVTVAWNMPTNNIDGSPLTDLAGAKVYYGTASSNYTVVVDAGNVETLKVTNLTAGVTYFFNSTAYNTAGLESDFCTEVAKAAKTRPGGLGNLEVDNTINLNIGTLNVTIGNK